MDRQGFLSSLPFLLQCPSSAWPPRRSSTISNHGNTEAPTITSTKMETLLDSHHPADTYQYKVSLEPAAVDFDRNATSSNSIMTQVMQQKTTEIQPAFFGRPTTEDNNGISSSTSASSSSFDPSMATIQVAVEYSESYSQDDPSVLGARVLFTGNNTFENTNTNNTNTNAADTTTSSSSRTQTPASLQKSTAATAAAAAVSTPKPQSNHFPRLQPQPQRTLVQYQNQLPLGLYFKIDQKAVYQVDGRQLLHAAVIANKDNKNDDDDDGNRDETTTNNKETELPPCLLLVFSTCIFRIFPLPHHPTSSNATRIEDADPPHHWKQTALQELQELEKLLLQFPHSWPSAVYGGSPSSGSSLPTSSGEAGQKDGTYHHNSHQQQQPQSHSTLTTTSSGSLSSGHKKLKTTTTTTTILASNKEYHDKIDAALQDNHQIRKIRRRRDALVRSRAGLQAVETVLEMPLSVYQQSGGILLTGLVPNHRSGAVTPAITADSQPKTQIHGNNGQSHNHNKNENSMEPLLTGIAEDIAASYGCSFETHEAIQIYQRNIDDLRNSRIEGLLDAFFPTMPNRQSNHHFPGVNKSRRYRHRGGRNNSTTQGSATTAASHKESKAAENTDVPVPSVEELMESVQDLMQKQNQLLQERNALFQLPTRG